MHEPLVVFKLPEFDDNCLGEEITSFHWHESIGVGAGGREAIAPKIKTHSGKRLNNSDSKEKLKNVWKFGGDGCFIWGVVKDVHRMYQCHFYYCHKAVKQQKKVAQIFRAI